MNNTPIYIDPPTFRDYEDFRIGIAYTKGWNDAMDAIFPEEVRVTKGTYFIPIKIELNAENPKAVVKMCAETIYDALTEKFNEEGFTELDSPVRKIDVYFSLYGKMDNQEEIS